MESNFDQSFKPNQKQFLHNIFTLIDQKGLKIGNVERNSGLSPGYLSRLAKQGNSFPTVETVWRLARTLGVSMEWLIEGSGLPGTNHADYLIQFISRLYDQTREDKLDWGRYTIWDINIMLASGAQPLFPAIEEAPQGKTFLDTQTLIGMDPTTCSCVTDGARTRRIRPVTRPDAGAAIHGSCFYTDLSDETRLFLLPYVERMFVGEADETGASQIDYVTWYELLSVNHADGAVLPVCNSLYENAVLAPALRKLHTELTVRENQVRVNPGVRSMIDAFMEKTAPIH